MIELLVGCLLLAGLHICAADWRGGLFVCVVVGFMQDPLRKIVPGQPVYFVLLVGVYFAMVCLSALIRGVRLRPSAIYGWERYLSTPFALYIILVGLQALHGLARYGNPVLAGIGFIAYLAPVPALLVGYRFALSGPNRMWQFLQWYAVLSTILTVGVFLEYLGVEWPVLGEIAGGFKIYDLGTVLNAYSGFMRTSEIAAWHAATTVCLLVILAIRSPGLKAKIPIAMGILAMVFAGVLTARRKMLVEIVIFLAAYWFLLALFRQGSRKVAVLAVAVGVVGFFFLHAADSPDLKNDKFQLYLERGGSVFGDIPERTQMSVFGTIKWAYARVGFLGAGAGAGSQGAQHFGGGTSLVGGAPEGGPGKILTELGIPGLVVASWLMVAVGCHVARIIREVSGGDSGQVLLTFGLVALLIANVATFLIATQAYGDPFVLLVLGWFVGFVLAAPELQEKHEMNNAG